MLVLACDKSQNPREFALEASVEKHYLTRNKFYGQTRSYSETEILRSHVKIHGDSHEIRIQRRSKRSEIVHCKTGEPRCDVKRFLGFV